MLRLITIVCCLSLCSCVATYVEPTSGETATVYATNVGASFRIFDNENCDNLRSPRGLDPSVPIKVPAGKPLLIGRGKVGAGMVSFTCASHQTFTPSAGATYEIGWDISLTPLRCDAPVSRIVEGNRKEREPTARRFTPGEGCANKY